MAHYTTTVHTNWSVEKAFNYVTDLRNLENWDPGVSSSRMAEGTEPGVNAVYAVKAGAANLRYHTRTYEPFSESIVEATTRFLRSYDVLTFAPLPDGAAVTYDATLELRGAAGLLNPLVGLFFDRIGDRAAKGLARALDGVMTA